jgi:hypothetical protein
MDNRNVEVQSHHELFRGVHGVARDLRLRNLEGFQVYQCRRCLQNPGQKGEGFCTGTGIEFTLLSVQGDGCLFDHAGQRASAGLYIKQETENCRFWHSSMDDSIQERLLTV